MAIRRSCTGSAQSASTSATRSSCASDGVPLANDLRHAADLPDGLAEELQVALEVRLLLGRAIRVADGSELLGEEVGVLARAHVESLRPTIGR